MHEGPLPPDRGGGFTSEPSYHQGFIRVNIKTPQLEVLFSVFIVLIVLSVLWQFWLPFVAAVLCSLWGITCDSFCHIWTLMVVCFGFISFIFFTLIVH